MMKRIALLLPAFVLALVIAPLGAQPAEASEYTYFKAPENNSTYTVGDKIDISFWAGDVITYTSMDAWGRPSTTTYEDVPAVLKVFKGTTELESFDFTYSNGTTLEATYVPKTAGTLKLRIYGISGLNKTANSLKDTLTITVKKKKASAVKTMRPVITAERVTKTSAEISCENDFGFGMKIYRATKKNGTYKLIATSKKPTYTDKKIKANKAYYYKVRLFAKSGSKTYQSKWSAVKQITKKPPAQITLSYSASKGVKVSWKPIKGTGYYLVGRKLKGADEYDVISCEGAETTVYYDTDVQKGKTYYYCITAWKGDDTNVGKYMNDRFKLTVAS